MERYESAVGHYGEFTARLMQHEDWRREAVRASQERAIYRAMRHDQTLSPEPGAIRLPVAIGGLLARVGQRLRGGSRVAAPAAR